MSLTKKDRIIRSISGITFPLKGLVRLKDANIGLGCPLRRLLELRVRIEDAFAHGVLRRWIGSFAFVSSTDLHSPVVSSLLFCQCGSDRVEAGQWNNVRLRIKCGTCGRECWLDGFTISDFDPAKLLTGVIVDQARKHRKRSPDEVGKIESQRRVADR